MTGTPPPTADRAHLAQVEGWLTVAEYGAAQLAAADTAMARLVTVVARHGRRIAADTGLSVQVWLETTCKLLAGDARAVLKAADVLGGLPFVWGRFVDGDLSWAVVRVVTAWLGKHPAEVRAAVDAAVEDGWPRLADAAPGAVLDVVERILAEVDHARERAKERRAERGEFAVLQPFLDGTGGSLYAEYGTVGFATIEQAILDARPDSDLQPTDGLRASQRSVAEAHNRQALGHANAQGLLALCSRQGDGSKKRPLLLASVSLEALLGLTNEPGHLLTHLTGGDLRITAKAARDLAGVEQGCDLRLHLFDDARPVGVGHTVYAPPDWLRDLVRLAHHTCTRPGCRRAARLADTDHAVPWDDDHPERGGATDIDNLHPVCRTDHRAKTRRDWQVEVLDDQSVTWTHPRTGTRLTQLSVWAIDHLAKPAIDRLTRRRNR